MGENTVQANNLLEPCAMKVACTVLRGERSSNAPDLPDPTKTVQLKTNDAGDVSLAPPTMRPGYHKDHGAFVVAIERVPTHLSTAAVLAAYRTAAVDVSFNGPSRIVWDALAGARPGQIVRASSGRAAQRLIAAGGSERAAQYIPRRRS